MTNRNGPPLEVLLRRLSETPQEFLDEPMIGEHGRVFVGALVNDLISHLGEPADMAILTSFKSSDQKRDRNWLALVMIAVWVLHDESFQDVGIRQSDVDLVLNIVIRQLSDVSGAHSFVDDPDRREEFARTLLFRLSLRPEGESSLQAADRLTAISSLERDRLLTASRKAEKRAREVREALARKAAQESADKWTRE